MSQAEGKPQVVVATLDGRAYFQITNLLRSIGLRFRSAVPGEPMEEGVKLVLSTRREQKMISFDKVLCVEDLDGDLAAAKVLMMVNEPKDDDLYIVGVDPGVRTGISAFYLCCEVYRGVVYSASKAVSVISRLIKGSSARKKIVRIGDGNLAVALRIAGALQAEYGRQIRIEIVDESGTSSSAKTRPNKRSVRDLRAARLIALRQGKEFKG